MKVIKYSWVPTILIKREVFKMFTKKISVYIITLVLIFLLSTAYTQTITKINTIKVNLWEVVDDKGNMSLSVRWIFPTSAMYLQIKRAYPNPYVIARNLLGSSATMELRNAKVSYEDQNNSLKLTTDVLGGAVNKKQRWTINIGKGADMLYSDGKRAIFLLVQSVGSDVVMIQVLNINLPKGVSDCKFDSKTGLFSYLLERNVAKGKTSVDFTVKLKPRIMSALYKVYGNPELFDGSYWVAKAIFRNIGTSDITDLRISYKLGDYTSWSPESTYNLVVPGGTVVDFYYPIISPQIAELKSATPCDLVIKYSYKDSAGKTYTDTTSYRLQVLGINQFEFSNLPEEERTGAWVDDFSNSPLISAFVTRLDDPVKAFAGMVSQYAGGVAAAANDEDAIKFCRALYELEVFNGISYQTPSGFLTEYSSGGQDLKYPRDVLRDKAGTCVDLAILYASVCEAVGLKSVIITIPGHAFPVIVLPSGQLLPVESTGVGGAAVGKSFSFDDAVKAGMKNLKELKMGSYFIIDVQELQKQGVSTPELPKLPADILKQWGYKSPTEVAVQPVPQPTPKPATVISGLYQGTYRNNITGATGNMNVQIVQSGNNIRGEIEIVDEGNGTITGTVAGTNIQFNATINAYYGQFSVTFTGVIQGNSISGNYSVPASGVNGTFVLNKIR
jgi:hypothetical protein